MSRSVEDVLKELENAHKEARETCIECSKGPEGLKQFWLGCFTALGVVDNYLKGNIDRISSTSFAASSPGLQDILKERVSCEYVTRITIPKAPDDGLYMATLQFAGEYFTFLNKDEETAKQGVIEKAMVWCHYEMDRMRVEKEKREDFELMEQLL